MFLAGHCSKVDLSFLQDDAIVHHMAAKAIENISTVVSEPSHHLVTTEIGSALWYLFTHSTVEAVRVTAISVSLHANMHINTVMSGISSKKTHTQPEYSGQVNMLALKNQLYKLKNMIWKTCIQFLVEH